MSTQDTWDWKVPTAKGTKWEPYAWKPGLDLHDLSTAFVAHAQRRTPLLSAKDTLWLNVYCQGRTDGDPHPLFLVGSLQAPMFILSNGDDSYWEFEETYLTGDGYEIYVNFREDMDTCGGAWTPRAAVFLEDKEEYNDEMLSQYAAIVGTGPDSPIRVTRDLHCKKCGLRATINSDNLDKVNEFATPLYEAGIREVSLKSFIRFAIQ